MNLGIYKTLPEKLHLEPTSNCNARCPQCPRTFRSSLLTDPRLNITEWDPADLKAVLEDKFFKKLKSVLVSGNYGDIVMHTKPKEFVQTLLDLNIYRIVINTNGGALSKDFWRWLGKSGVIVEFGIDGLEDTHHLYRRNTRFEVVIKNAKTFIEAGGIAIWSMTVFKHNEHQIEECRNLSEEYGFLYFKERPSTRWSKKDQIILDSNMKESYRLEPASIVKSRFEDLKRDEYKKVEIPTASQINILSAPPLSESLPAREIKCSVAEDKSVYLSADGKLYPCCWTAISHKSALFGDKKYSSFVQTFYKDLGYDIDFNNVLKNNITDIINSGLFAEIEETWYSNKQFDVCRKQCSANSNWNYQLNNSNIKFNR